MQGACVCPCPTAVQPPPGLTVEFLLASVVSRALGAPLTLPLQPLFVCPPALVSTLQPMLLPGVHARTRTPTHTHTLTHTYTHTLTHTFPVFQTPPMAPAIFVLRERML